MKFPTQEKALISNSQHLIIESAHSSPLSAYRGFLWQQTFSRTNDFLTRAWNPIDWLTGGSMVQLATICYIDTAGVSCRIANKKAQRDHAGK